MLNAKYTAAEVEAIDYVGPAIPVMFSMILLEVIVGRLQGKKIYRANDAVNRYVITFRLHDFTWISETIREFKRLNRNL